MNTWKVILATMVIFGAGVVTGGLLVRLTAVKPQKSAHANVPGRSIPTAPGVTRVELLRRAERELDLTPEQREKADKLIAASQERTKKIVEPVAPRIRDELKQTRDQFRALLTADQQARFDEMVKKAIHHDPHKGPAKPEKAVGVGQSD